MDISQAVILAAIQGITEFLPISSSAHLILLPAIMEWKDQGLAFDIAVHFGTLFGLILHYIQYVKWRPQLNPRRRAIIYYILIASIPLLIIGYTLANFIEQNLRSPLVIATTSISFGLLLWFATWQEAKTPFSVKSRLNPKMAIIIGLSQALALIPGVSRAGITITAGFLLGLPRHTAINFSFALAIPAILAASLYQIIKLITSTQTTSSTWIILAVGFCVSATLALATIRVFFFLLPYIGLMPFIIYRIFLSVILFILFL